MQNFKYFSILLLTLPLYVFASIWPFAPTCFEAAKTQKIYIASTAFMDFRTKEIYSKDQFIAAQSSGKISYLNLKHFQVLKFDIAASIDDEIARLKKLFAQDKSKTSVGLADSDFLNSIVNLNPHPNLCYGRVCQDTEYLHDNQKIVFLDLNQKKTLKPTELQTQLETNAPNGYNNIFAFEISPDTLVNDVTSLNQFLKTAPDGKTMIDFEKVKADKKIKTFMPVKFDQIVCEGSQTFKIPGGRGTPKAKEEEIGK